ncbi:hypothetical protein OOZ53_11270 [Hoeflea sp. E7-10]|uniref:Uncharacterized protein n=1 Tax=Hoeflea poritis TaxID=2993659 RepID=A0ABT4VPD3_9HYPH|nr:hypothetical protein [Hoeflea poritis]
MDLRAKIVNDLIRKHGDQPAHEVDEIIRKRFAPLGGVILEEWFKEPLRRAAMKRQAKRRRAVKHWNRRRIRNGKPMRYHPTKGWRYA